MTMEREFGKIECLQPEQWPCHVFWYHGASRMAEKSCDRKNLSVGFKCSDKAMKPRP